MSAPALRPATRAQGARRVWTVVAAVALPLVVLGLLLWALWNPQERLDTVQAAIVNHDEPVEVDGQTVPLGRQLTAGLVSGGAASTDTGPVAVQSAAGTTNYDWVITDSDDASAGLADGTYAAVVTIPENFSAAATSFGGDDPSAATQATLTVDTAPGGRVVDEALARIVTTTATTVLGQTLTENYVDGVLVGFTTLNDQLGEAADGATQLADGASDASDGADQLADGADQVADGAGELASGVGELDSGADQLASGAGQLASGADGVASGTAQSAAGADGIAGGVEDLATGTQGLATGARDLADGLGRLDAGLQPGASSPGLVAATQQLATGSAGVADGVSQLVDQLTGAGQTAEEVLDQLAAALGCDGSAGGLLGQLPPEVVEQIPPDVLQEIEEGLAAQSEDLCADIEAAQEQLAGQLAGLGQLDDAAQQVAAGNAALAEQAPGIVGAVDQLSSGADALAGGVEETAAGAGDLAGGARGLATGLGQLSAGADGLATGADTLASGTAGLADGVGQLATGADQLATGTDGLATGATDLAGGVGQLASGTSDLADGLGEATDQIPSYTDDEAQHLASVVANPVESPGTDGLGTGSTGPLFAVLALWLGALALFVAFPPVPAQLVGSTLSAGRLALRALALPVAVGAATGAVVGGVLAGVEGASVGGWCGLVAVGVLSSVTFVLLNQALAALLGNVGRALSLLVAVLLVATGIVATVPAALVGLRDLLPVGSALGAFTAIVDPGAVGGAGDVVALVLWALASFAVTTLVVARRRTVRVEQLLRA